MTTPPADDPNPEQDSAPAQPEVPAPSTSVRPGMKVFGAPDVVEEPESNVPNRSDWKLMMLASTAFLVLAIALAVAAGGRRGAADFEHAATVPFIGFNICFLYGFWKLLRLQDRTGKEESLLGFLTILGFTPVCWTILTVISNFLPSMFIATASLPLMFLPFALVLVLRRQTNRASARGNFASGVGLGCGALFLLAVLGISLICGVLR